MPSKQLSAGDYIKSRCTKCDDLTNHTVIAMTGDTPAKVMCNICGGQHKYRPATAPSRQAPAKKTSSAAARKRETVSPDLKAWLALAEQESEAGAVAYAMDGAYADKTLIQHPVFGLGQVQRQVGAQKMEVLFKGGRKILRCR